MVALDALPDVLGSLGDAEHRAPGGLEHLAGPRVHLPGNEERDQHVGELREVALALHEIVLVTAVGVPRRVGVVLEEIDLAPDTLLTESLLGTADEPLEDPLPRLVMHDEVRDGVALRRCVLGVAADVEVQPGTVLEEHVARPTPRDDPAEEVTGDFVGAEPALSPQGARHSVLVLEAEDPPFHAPMVPGDGARPVARPSSRSWYFGLDQPPVTGKIS